MISIFETWMNPFPHKQAHHDYIIIINLIRNGGLTAILLLWYHDLLITPPGGIPMLYTEDGEA